MAYKERNNILTEWWYRVVGWRERHIKERSFVVILAFVVGIQIGRAHV